MYDHILGDVIEKQPARAVVRAGGVGYELKISMSTAGQLTVGKESLLYTILHVVDGNPILLGFATVQERELARMLLSVTGVGPAMCMTILSTYSPSELVGAITRGEAGVLRKVRGVGTKTAERLCLELRDRVIKLEIAAELAQPAVVLPRPAEDAIAALVTLGFAERDAAGKVEKACSADSEATTEQLIKSVLRG